MERKAIRPLDRHSGRGADAIRNLLLPVIPGLRGAQNPESIFCSSFPRKRESSDFAIARHAGAGRHRPSSSFRGWPKARTRNPAFRHSGTTTCLSFSARLQGERATFVSAKVAKTMALDAMATATSCCRDSPARLAEQRPRRTRTSLCSNMRRLPRRSAAPLGIAYSAGKLAQHGHPWPALWVWLSTQLRERVKLNRIDALTSEYPRVWNPVRVSRIRMVALPILL